ncbi:putative ACR protein [Marine Group I thaumarchaeote SCGC AAA799-E16]|uniref:Putative ACR protein n=4 Tax=Marine Group I TaxID=905826 RepID=A0A087S5Y2_9ARCH|nr:putative ACR protein [Marine Group I thaumarchaeote SCGC AAA799-E16]KFM16072.1 putative ACR protein [Marine Group I thaumarchaeote SCGC AAA799-D11]KFM17809.1 putative ACR protein [Marine Group I thaumarchaeote SCGC RSA3]KFM21136.1 putative ACR protein [Marine Group I thaumarchaeote SCGC AAA799-B03]
MTTRAQALIPISIAAVIIGVVGLMSIPSESKLESVEFPIGTIKVDDVPLEVQIADTEPRRVRGLMFQDQLPYDQGMIFVFSEPGLYSLWMLNMQFPLDMIWFDENGKVVHIEQDVPPCKAALEIATCQSVVPENEAVYILEVTAGFVEQNNITKESVLTIISI